MKVDKEKLKNATMEELIDGINLANAELSDTMWEPSWARCKELLEYKEALQKELMTKYNVRRK